MCTVTLEAEDGNGGVTVVRSGALGGHVVSLMRGDFISYKMKYMENENSCVIKLMDVTYSIDGHGTAKSF